MPCQPFFNKKSSIIKSIFKAVFYVIKFAKLIICAIFFLSLTSFGRVQEIYARNPQNRGVPVLMRSTLTLCSPRNKKPQMLSHYEDLTSSKFADVNFVQKRIIGHRYFALQNSATPPQLPCFQQ